MPPKKTTQPEVVADMSAGDKKKQQSSMVTSLKAATDPDKVAVYTLYTSLSRTNPEKGVLLAQWLKDKQCKWANNYIQTRSVTNEKVTDSLDGYGTVFSPLFISACGLFVLLCSSSLWFIMFLQNKTC